MRSVPLGERTVTSVGCGDLSLAIAASRGIDRRDAERALTVALELGLSLVDVHPGEDDAERLAGDVVRALRLRDSAITAITVPLRGGRDTPIERLPPAYLVARVETALRNTKLDALPLVQLPLRPSWLTSKMWLELEGTAARLIREGKVLAFGARLEPLDRSEHDEPEPDDAPVAISGAYFSRESGARAPREREEPPTPRELSHELSALIAVPWFVSLSVPFSLCARDVEPLVAAALAPIPLGPEAPPPAPSPPVSSLILSPFDITTPMPTVTKAPPRRTAPLAVLARQPLAGGALAGTIAPGAKLTQRDDRNAIDHATLERIAIDVARLSTLVRTVPPAARSTEASRGVLERQNKHDRASAVTLAELALRYVIDRGAIAMPRLHRHTVVPDALIAAASDPLPAQVLAFLDEKT